MKNFKKYREWIAWGLVVLGVLGFVFFYGDKKIEQYYENRTLDKIYTALETNNGVIRLKVQGKEREITIVWTSLLQASLPAPNQ